MERSRRLYELWSWLIPFRVVAETESLQAASDLLHVAPSALSRSVAMLEDRLGVALFDRRSNRLALNDAGHRLLAAVRTGMRGIDDGVVDAIGDAGARTVRIACPGELAPIALGPVAALAAELAPFRFAVDEIADRDAVPALLRGSIDVAVVVASAAAGDGGVVRRVGALPRAVFVAAADREPTALRFAVRVDRDGVACDGVAPGVARTIGLRATTGGAVLEAVRAAAFAAVLPRAVGRAAGLIELDAGIVAAPLELAVVTRPPIAAGDPIQGIADRLAAALRQVGDA